MSEKVIVSACLLEQRCRWDGRVPPYSETVRQFQLENPSVELVPVCPEMLGGLPVPRTPCKLVEGRVFETSPDKTKREETTGTERTAVFHAGAEEALRLARLGDCRLAFLRENSPSCDIKGITGQLLLKNGIEVIATR